jgi:hypothetical protein
MSAQRGPYGIPQGFKSQYVATQEWELGGTLSLGLNSYVGVHRATGAEQYVAFDANVLTAPSGAAINVDWLVNGNVVPSLRTTIPDGSTYGSTTWRLTLGAGDTLQPQISQIGSTIAGTTIVMRARGI